MGVILVLTDVCAIALAIALAAAIRLPEIFLQQWTTLLPILVLSYLFVAANTRAFDLAAAVTPDEGRGLTRAIGALLATFALLLGIVFYLKSSEELSRIVIGLSLVFSGFFLGVGRQMFAKLATRRLGGSLLHQVLIVDGLPIGATRQVHIVDAQALGIEPRSDDPIMLDMIGRYIEDADRVIVACVAERRISWVQVLRAAAVNVEVLAPELDLLQPLGVNRFDGMATALVSVGPLGRSDRMLKRLLDLTIVVLAAPVVAPLMALVAVAIKLDSRGPVLFVQERVGQGNRLFPMFKFRSMRTDALDRAGTVSTARGDPRITRVGGLIRKLSIDELPQLINVLRGEMSVVGPRPHAIGSTADDALFWEIEVRYWDRHAAKPGLTGLAQVRGFRGSTAQRSDLTDRLDADLAYLQHWTLWRDIKIIIGTFRVLFHSNAF